MDKFDEYTYFAQSTQHLAERRQNVTHTFLTVNTALFLMIAFLVKDAKLAGLTLAAAAFPLFFVGILACFFWYKCIMQYKRLIGWRYDQLMAIEREMDGSHQMYTKEWEDFFKPQAGKQKISFSKLELCTPWLVLGLYAFYGICVIVVKALAASTG